MEIKIATTPEEKQAIYELRYRCYIEELGWQYQNADQERRHLRDEGDEMGTLYYASDEGRVIATCRVHFSSLELENEVKENIGLHRFSTFPPEAHGYICRLVVLSEYRGTTVMIRLLQRGYADARHHGMRFCFCWCRPRLVEIYERLGFTRYKDNVSNTSQGYVVPMVLLTEDSEHLRSVRSPFLRLCQAHSPSRETSEWFDRNFPQARQCVAQHRLGTEEVLQQWAEAMNTKQTALLSGFTTDQIKSLVQAGTVLAVKEGDTLLHQDEAGHEMFLILDGVVRFSQRKQNGSESQIALVGKGEVFGEITLVSKAKHYASVQAVTDLQVLVISQEFLQRAMKSLPEIALKLLYNLSHVLAQKLQTTTLQWQDSVRENEKLALLVARRDQGAKPAVGRQEQERTVIFKKI